MCLFKGLYQLLKFIICRPVKCMLKFVNKLVGILFPCVPCCRHCIVGTDWMKSVGFLGGIMLAQIYYQYLLKKIIFPYHIGSILAISLSLLLGAGNAICRQLRCISLLCVPMYCGKSGRGVLKAVVLTYVIAGPITNMGLNAKEVVRVFGCTTNLAQNLSRAKHALMAGPLHSAVFMLRHDLEPLKDAMRSFRKIAAPIEDEIEGTAELNTTRREGVGGIFAQLPTSEDIDRKYAPNPNDTEQSMYHKKYVKKLAHRCNAQLARAVEACAGAFDGALGVCLSETPHHAAWAVCWPLKINYICNFLHYFEGSGLCDSEKQVDRGLSEGYLYLKRAKREMTHNLEDVQMQYRVSEIRQLYDVQDSKETGDRVMQAFEEKHLIMQYVINGLNICVALLFLRIVIAAGSYHDDYLTSIGYDNVYITGYFKNIDRRRSEKNKCTLLPLKKMERSKYIDVHSFAYSSERAKLLTQVLKVMLEMVTATTFVMLDRLFYEALDVVRQHAEAGVHRHGEHDLNIQVDGKGLLANAVRTLLASLDGDRRAKRTLTNRACLPRPRSMPPEYFLKIYGGYLWILLLLYYNPYTLRLRRLICCWFYPRREKQRILHLYNDILKKRLKLSKTLRRKAVQAVRAHYLSGENLLSLRMKFPQVLGWLRMLPAARMTCLICGETEPRSAAKKAAWYSCDSADCPFVSCAECWREAGSRCLACDPALADLSDIDSLSEDEQPKY